MCREVRFARTDDSTTVSSNERARNNPIKVRSVDERRSIDIAYILGAGASYSAGFPLAGGMTDALRAFVSTLEERSNCRLWGAGTPSGAQAARVSSDGGPEQPESGNR